MIRPDPTIPNDPETTHTATDPRGTSFTHGPASAYFDKATESTIPAITALKDGLTAFTQRANVMVQELNPKIVPERMQTLAKQMLSAPFVAAQSGTIQFAERHDTNVAKFETVPVATDHVAEAGHRDSFRVLNLAEKLKALQVWPMPAIFAIVRVGRGVWGLDESQWDIALRRVRAHNLTNSHDMQIQFAKKPSFSNPVARGVDENRIAQFAAEALEQWREKKEAIATAGTILQRVCILVGVMCDIKPEEAYSLLTSQE